MRTDIDVPVLHVAAGSRVDTTSVIWSEELYRIHEIDPGTSISTDIARLGVHPDDVPIFYGIHSSNACARSLARSFLSPMEGSSVK
jgi:hypothetical protein